jgi:hypothetical protein
MLLLFFGVGGKPTRKIVMAHQERAIFGRKGDFERRKPKNALILFHGVEHT